MFEKELQNKLRTLFGFEKVTFNAPSESFEQDTLFIEIEKVSGNASVGQKKQSAKVTGALVVFSQGERLPFGFFRKRFEQASPSLRAPFFIGAETDNLGSPARLQNINERRCEFTFLFESQYDPNQGELTSLTFGE